MSHKNLLSVGLLVLVLQACGDTPDEKKLKRQNEELRQENSTLVAESKESAHELETVVADLEVARRRSAEAMTARIRLESELAGRRKALVKLQDELSAKDQVISAKEAEIANLLASSAAVKAELEARLAEKDAAVAGNALEIARLQAQLKELSGSIDVEGPRAEIAKLKEERELLKTSLAQADAAANTAKKELDTVKARAKELENRLNGILEKSMGDVQGLWLNQSRIAGISDGACYEFVHLAPNGNFVQAIACQDGRVQMQKHAFDHFAAQGVPDQKDNDYVGAYGLVIDGVASKSGCPTSGDSLLKTGDRLVFEMTRQDFDRDLGSLISRSMLVALEQGFKGYINAAVHFTGNNWDYATMSGLAGRSNASPMSKAAASFIGALEGQGTNIRVGCFNGSGAFTATSN